MATAKWLLQHTSRQKFRNRLEELNARYGPAPEVVLPGWLDHYPQTADEWRYVGYFGIEPPVAPPPPKEQPRRAPSQPVQTPPPEQPLWTRPRW